MTLHPMLLCALATTLALTTVAPAEAQQAPPAARRVLDQLTPENSVVLLVDFQPQFAFSTRSASIDSLVANAQGLLKAAKSFHIPVVTTTITARAFAGPMLADLADVDPANAPVDRTVINAWADPRVRTAITSTGRRKLIIAGLWTDNCVVLPALAALGEGYDVYVVTDASGDYDVESHDRAVQRLVQAGAVPITWLPVMLEWQGDWARQDTAGAVQRIMRENAKALAAGAQYAGARVP